MCLSAFKAAGALEYIVFCVSPVVYALQLCETSDVPMKYYPSFLPQDNMSAWVWLVAINQDKCKQKNETERMRKQGR